MNLFICTIGKWKKAPESTLYDHYIRRSRWPVELRELTGFPALDTSERQRRETELLFTTVRDEWRADRVIALDETGRSLSSRAFASQVGSWQDTGSRRIACLIGGDVGLDKAQLPQADLLLSFGTMTWPHLLVRVLLAEQLYRAQTILTGHPYHRD
jgi:23S rRNA (pseudouridine1915-N3)-methyltransferase